MFQNDDIFFYKEKINPENPDQVMYRGEWTTLSSREEKIYIKGKKEPVLFQIKHSPHGPILNGVVEEFSRIKEPVAMWWAFANPENDMLTAFYDLAREKDFAKVPNHLSRIHAPGLNVMYADQAKNIAWWAVAKIPDFAEDIDTQDFLDATNSRHQIDRFFPFAKNPHLVNPKEGFIVSANNDPKLSLKNLRRIPGYYSNGQRYQRIKTMLQQRKEKWDLSSMKSLQMDDKDSIHKKIVPVLLKAVASEKHSKTSELALQTLKEWDGSHQLKDVGPTIYYMFISHMVHYVFEKKLSGDLYRHLMGSHHLYSVTESLINKPQSVWWNVSPELKTQEKVLQKAWTETMKTLTRDIGSDASQWNWGKVHVLEQEHPIGKKKPFNLIFNVGPTPLTGGYETVDKESFHLSTKLPFKVKSGPSTRRLIDLADTTNSLGINPKGQAGYFFDDHYSDQLKLFAKGEYREQIMDMKKVKSQNPRTLTFK